MFALARTCLITLSRQKVAKKSHSLTARRVSQRQAKGHKLIPTNRLLDGWIFISMVCNLSITSHQKDKHRQKGKKCAQSHVTCHRSYGVTNKEQGLGNPQQSCARSWCWHTLALAQLTLFPAQRGLSMLPLCSLTEPLIPQSLNVW